MATSCATGVPRLRALDRDTLKQGAGKFGSVEYAREELRAEISAMLTGARVGVGHDGSRGATYVTGWLTALEHDPQEIDKAAAEAQHMSDYLLCQIREHEQAIAQKHAELAEQYSYARGPQISSAPPARPLDPPPPLPVGADGGPRADDRPPEGDPPPRRARRSGAGARGTSSVTRPPVQDRASQFAALAALGWTGRAAEWIALVCLHSGVFTRAQWRYFFDDPHREPVRRFVRKLLDRSAGVEDERALFPGSGRAVYITQKPIYRALGIPDVRHRRGTKATTQVLMRRLLSLDYLIERPTLGWLPTEAEKVQRFTALGIDRAMLPYRTYDEGEPAQKRFVALKCPVAVDAQAATFVYVDAGQSTDSELRAWGVAHAPLWAALRARTFAVHIVAVGTGAAAAERAAPVLTRWTQDGDGQGAPALDTPTKADPEIRKEMAALTTALTAGTEKDLTRFGGFDKAADRILYLEELPDGTPTTQTARGAIDRGTTWSTIRLISPEAAT